MIKNSELGIILLRYKKKGIKMFGKLIKKQDSQEVVGNAVLELRKSMGLTQKELADRVGKPQSTIARIETGNMAPSFSLISDIATALNKKLNINFEDRDDKELMWTYPLVIFGYETKEVGKERIQLYKWANKLVEKFNAFLKMHNLQARFLDFTISYAKISFRYSIDFEQEGISKEKLEELIDFQQWGNMMEMLMDLEEVEVHLEQNYLVISVRPEKLLPINIRQLFESGLSGSENHPLQAVLGEGEDGEAVTLDLSQHSLMLVSGLPASGKTVGINGLVASIMAHNSAEQVGFAFFDPFNLEFSRFKDSQFLAKDFLTDMTESTEFLASICQEKAKRQETLTRYGLSMSEYNERIDKKEITDEKLKPLIFVIDEYTAMDNVLNAEAIEIIGASDTKDVGIHLILSTQRTRKLDSLQKLITCRWIFRVGEGIDSETALGRQGAENLRGSGDSYLYQEGDDKPIRLQAPFIDYKVIEAITEYLKREVGKPINRDSTESVEG